MNNNNTTTDPCNLCNECEETQNCCTEPDYITSGCVSTVNDECVIVTLDNIECTDIQKGNSFKTVLTKLVNMIKGLFGRITSETLTVTRTGTCEDNLEIELVPSTDANNQLIIGTDGKPFSKKTDVNIINIPYLTFTKTIVNGVITFTPELDIAGIADAVCQTCSGTPSCDPAADLALVGQLQVDSTVDLDVTWTDIPTVTYDVYLDSVLVEADVDSPYTIPGLDPDTTYNVEVRSHCGNGENGSVDEDITTPSLPSCTIPSNLNANIT